MPTTRLLAIVLIIAGALGLVYDRVTYVKERHKAEIGPISVSVDETKTVSIPMWAGIAAIVVGVGLIAIPKKA